MKNKLNTIPFAREAIIQLTQTALEGAIRVGATVGLVHNTAEDISIDSKALMGAPAVPPAPAIAGTQGLLEQAEGHLRQARRDYDAAVRAGCVFAGKAIDSFKPALGRTYGPDWQLAGFGRGSISVPKEPTTLLIETRSFLIANPMRENVTDGITATAAEAVRLAIQQKRGAYDQLRGAVVVARGNRNAALKQLRSRLSGLRAELDQLLDDDDENWLVFGFRRPSEGRLPEPVTGLVLAFGAAGQVVATWERATRAESYRVTYRINAIPDETDLGLFTAQTAILTGLPTGATVTVDVSAHNTAGESDAATAAIVVP